MRKETRIKLICDEYDSKRELLQKQYDAKISELFDKYAHCEEIPSREILEVNEWHVQEDEAIKNEFITKLMEATA